MKSREPRQTVIIPAQMRGDFAWSDVCIRNLSSHGMMLQMTKPPAPGSYVELRRASAVVVARVMWADANCCGLRTQTKVDIGVLSGEKAEPRSAVSAPARVRAEPIAWSAERAAMIGRRMQFVCGAVFGALVVTLLSLVAYEALARPLAAVREVLR